MGFNPNIPQASDPIQSDYLPLRSNFQAIAAAFDKNHVGLTQDPSISGMHDLFLFQPQTVDPSTGPDEVALYTKLVSSVPNLFYRPSNSQDPIQLTYQSVKTDGSNDQYSFVAGPFLIYGGLIQTPTNGQTFTVTPASNLIYVDLTLVNVSNRSTRFLVAAPVNISGSSFDIEFPVSAEATTFDLWYFAIGLPT